MTQPIKRKGMEFRLAIPTEDGALVSMCKYKGMVLVACQYAIYQLCEKENTFKKLKFEVKP